MSTLLFVAPADLSEAVLASGALDAVSGADVEASIACTPDAAALFRAAPGVKEIVVLHGGGLRATLTLARHFVGAQFDLALDLSGRRVAYAVRARRRLIRAAPRELRHLAEDFAALVGVEQLKPRLWPDAAAREQAAAIAGTDPMLALAPGARHVAKRWPAERFAAAARRLVSGAGPMAGARVAVLGEASDAALTRAIVASLDADGVAATDAAGRLDTLASAALLEHAILCVAVENPIMHLAAAAGAPTLGLFGPSDERIIGPYGPRTRALRGRPYEEIMASSPPGLDERSRLEDLSVDAVEQAALDLLRAGGLR